MPVTTDTTEPCLCVLWFFPVYTYPSQSIIYKLGTIRDEQQLIIE